MGQFIPSPFAEWLQSYFEYKTQKQAAIMLSISPSYMHDLGYNKRRLNVGLALKIERLFPNDFNARDMLIAELDFDLEAAGRKP